MAEAPRRGPYGGPLGWAVFGAAAACSVAWLLVLGRNLTFFFDEWDFVREAATTGYGHNVLHPHNGHPSMVPFSVYWVLLHTVGLRHYWPYLLVLALVNVLCGWLLFVLLRHRVHPVAAAAAAAALMLLGPAWQDLLWPFQIGFLGSVAGGLGALVLLDRRTTGCDAGAMGCLVLSVGCSGVGLPFVAGVAVELLWRRSGWRRLWVPAVPLGLFVAWYETVGRSPTTSTALATMARSMGSATSKTVGGLVGQSQAVGAVLCGVLGVLVVVALVRHPGRAARLAMAVSGLFTFWVLTLVARGAHQASPSRYLYPAAAFVLVAAGELPTLVASRRATAHHAAGPPRWATSGAAVILAAVVGYAGLAVWRNASVLTSGAGALASTATQVRAELGAVVLAGQALPAGFRPDTVRMPQVAVGPFRRAVAEFGSPGATRAQIARSSESVRSGLDAMLLDGTPVTVTPAIIIPPSVWAHCTTWPIVTGQPLTVQLPADGLWVSTPRTVGVTVSGRALASAFPATPITNLAPGTTHAIRWPAQHTTLRWTLEFTPTTTPVPAPASATLCPAGPG